MANEQKIIDISVNYSKAVNDLIETKNAITKLRVENVELSKDMATNGGQVLANNAQIKNLTATLNQNTKAVQNEVLQVKGAEGAYQKLNLEYQLAAKDAKDLAAQNILLGNATEAQTKAADDAAKKANDLNEQLKKVDATVGQSQRNVGDYSGALSEFGGKFGSMLQNVQNFTTANDGLAGSFKAGGQAVGGFGKQLLSLLANPIVAIIAAIAGAVMLMVKAIKSNGEATEKLNQILAPFKNILSAVMNVVGKLASTILSGVLAIMDFGNAVMSVIPGLDKLAEKNKEAISIEKEKQRLIREGIVDKANDAKEELRIAELKKKINQADKYSKEQRLAMAKEVDKAEKVLALDDANRANNNLKIFLKNMELQGKTQKQYTIDELQQLADLQAKKYEEQTAYFEKTKKTASREAALTLEIQAENQKKKDKLDADNQKRQEKISADNEKRIAKEAANLAKRMALAEKIANDEIKITERKLQIELKSLSDKLELSNLIQDEELAGKIKTDAEWLKLDNDKLIKERNNKLSRLANEKDAYLDNIQTLNEELLKFQSERQSKERDYKIASVNEQIEIENSKIKEGEQQKVIIAQEAKTKIAQNNAAADAKIKADKLQSEAMALDNEFELAKNDVDRQLQLTYDKLEAQRLAEVTAANGNAELIKQINEKYRLEDIKATEEAAQKKIDNIFKYAEAAQGILNGASNFAKALGDAELANWAKTNKGKANFDAEYAKKKAKIDHDAAVRTKALGIMDATISTAAAIIKMLANPGGFAGLALSIAAGVTGALQVGTILATPIPSEVGSSSSNSTTTTSTTTATTKFHTGKELGQTSPNSQLKSDEIFSKIQTVETVLDSRSSGIFDNIIRNVSLQGGSNNITSNIGTNQIDQSIMIEAAMSRAFAKMPPTQLSLTEWNNFQARQLLLEENRVIK